MIVISRQLATRTRRTTTRSTRHTLILSAEVDDVTLMIVNAHMPTSWGALTEYEIALTDIDVALEEMSGNAATGCRHILLLGDWTVEWPKQILDPEAPEPWPGEWASEACPRAAALAAFAQKWNCQLPKCNDNAMKSYPVAEKDYDLVMANVAVNHQGCRERAPDTQRASDHRPVMLSIAIRAGARRV